MNAIQEKVRTEAARLLEAGEVSMVIGWEQGSDLARTSPAFTTTKQDVDCLVWSPFCAGSLVKYLLDYRYGDERIAVCVKGCDERAVNRLIRDNQFARERVVVLGLPCAGMLDREKVLSSIDQSSRLLAVEDRGDAYALVTENGTTTLSKRDYLLEKCRSCSRNIPAAPDVLLGATVPSPALPGYDAFAEVRQMEALTAQEKSAFWDREFSKCIRCYACRNVCPACNCTECAFEQAVPGWQQGAPWVSKSTSLSENYTFHLIRMFDVAGRCIDCGECERVCPMSIPLRILYRKVVKDAGDLFAVPGAGLQSDEDLILCTFDRNDREEFD